MFDIYLKLGFQHILDFNAYDHMLFIMALCAVYTISDWKKVLVLVSAFTIGHSISLALSAYNVMRINPTIIEFLIPITIILTCMYNIFNVKSSVKSMNVLYVSAAFFGLIHGMGFSNYLNALLGQEESIVMPLLGFNIGVEGGQLVVVAIAILLSYLFHNIVNVSNRYWTILVSFIAIVISLSILYKQI